MRIVTLGGSGFIGSHVIVAARSAGFEPVRVGSFRVAPSPSGSDIDPAEAWQHENPGTFSQLCREFDGAQVVINAAGLAAPERSDRLALVAANAIHPAVVARACQKAGVRRLVHISTAAVQGRQPLLDETAVHLPTTPYAASKAMGERLLLNGNGGGPPEVVVYRAASVFGTGRAVTVKLARFASLPIVPLTGMGEQPVPAMLIDNVAAGIVWLATSTEVAIGPEPLIVLQPDEGLTVGRLVDIFGAGRRVNVPSAAARLVVAIIDRAASPSAFLASRSRWLDLLWVGQCVRAEALSHAGFSNPVGDEGWRALARTVREHSR